MSTSVSPKRATDRTLLLESIFIMLFASVLYGVTFTFDRVPPLLAQGIQPTVFPRAMLLLMFALGALQAVKALRVSSEKLADLKPLKSIPLIVFATAGMLIAFAIAIPILGTFVAMAIFLPALALLWGERRWKIFVPSFLGFLGFAYVLFRMIMNVPLP